MRLKSAASFFDKTTAKDAYAPTVEFKCQVEPFDYVKIDGSAVKRRVMSTAPEVTIPARRAISIGTQVYLVGDTSPDHWDDEVIRHRHVLQGADHLAQVRTIAEILADTAGTTAYASVEFNKYSTDERDSSDYHPQYHVFFGGGESAPEGSVITADGRHYLVRMSHRTMGGLLDALSNELEAPIIDSATFSVQTYDPLTDTYSGTPTVVRCVRVRWQDHFTYLSQGSEKYERGDVQVFVPLSVTPKAGDTLTLADGVYTVLSVLTVSGYRSLHLRRA